MTLGGFTAIATIVKARISGGLNDKGEEYIGADMELEGKLLVFHYGSLKDTLRQKTKAEAYIQIEFKEYQQQDNCYEDGETKYIGDIRLREEATEVQTFVNITLPLSIFPILKSMKGENITFDTTHDMVNNPSRRQKADNIVALVKRAYFEISHDIEGEKTKREILY